MSAGRDGFFLGGVGSDVFGEHNAARLNVHDPVNDYLRNKYLTEYILWHRENARFYDGFEQDCMKLKMLQYTKWAITLGSVAFAAVVINPNFTNRRSYYARKLIPFAFGVVGYQYGYRNQNIALTNTLLRMQDYLPLEVRRTM